jgi:PAS domain S-box-containing protein
MTRPQHPAAGDACGPGTTARDPGPGEEGYDTADIHRLFVASVRDYAMFVLDPAGHIRTWNRGAERLKGYAADEIIGRHFSTFYPEEDLVAGKPDMELRVAGAEGRFEDEGWRVRKDGSLFWANVIITALRREEDGTLVGFAKVTRDLTDRRAAELEAVDNARRAAEAEAANRAKSEFLAVMSHELRTPLNAIGGYVDLLAAGVHGPLTEAQRVALERVRASQQHLLVLINDLLNFTRIEADRVSYELAPVALAEVARAVGPVIEPQAASKSLTIEWQPGDAAVAALADRARVEQILLNLLTNAVKYTERGGHVQVRHFLDGDRAVLEVSDDGIGIPEAHIDAIFEPFTQLGRSLTSGHEGTGLGLAISRDLARAMDGDLTARSALGQGSTFTLALPRTRDTAERPDPGQEGAQS